ncbi:MAG: hypothetical protein F6K50_38420, partial [Moorea sp. SIO3I7]|nr:hypothetical protein [Moorena sp. SIO3I7]
TSVEKSSRQAPANSRSTKYFYSDYIREFAIAFGAASPIALDSSFVLQNEVRKVGLYQDQQ